MLDSAGGVILVTPDGSFGTASFSMLDDAQDRPDDAAAWAPFAAAMFDFHRGERGVRLLLRDDYGDTAEVPVAHFFRAPQEFPPLEADALARCRGRVLDVGAGSGCHAVPLQERGFEVCAIDVVPELVQVMRERGVRDVRHASLADLDGERFDTVVLLMNGLGLAGTLGGLVPLLAEARSLLAPGGQILTDGTDLRTAYGIESGVELDRRADGRYVGELVLQLEYAGVRGAPFPYLYVDPDTLSTVAGEAGWQVEVVAHDRYGAYLARLVPV